MPSKVSRELIALKPKSLGIAMSIAQDIFKAHNLGNIASGNINNNIIDEDRIDIDALNIDAMYPRNTTGYTNNYQGNNHNNNYKRYNNYNKGGHNNHGRGGRPGRGHMHYDWFKDKMTREIYDDRLNRGICINCGSWQHIAYNCPDESGKAHRN